MEFSRKGNSNNFSVFGFYKSVVMSSFLETEKESWRKTEIEME